MTPSNTLKFKGEKCVGGKMSKDRVTILVGANMTGTKKEKLLVVGKSRNPRCFKNVKQLPVRYEHNKKAWMTSLIFENYLRNWDRQLKKEHKKILLLVDNCPAHPKVEGLQAIRLEFLPPNTTSVLQPMDQGIIRSLKAHYRKLQVLEIVKDSEHWRNINLLEAILLISKSWERVTCTTIANCFIHSGLRNSPTQEEFEEEDDWPLNQWIQHLASLENVLPSTFDELLHVDDDLLTTATLTDKEIVEQVQKDASPDTDEEEGA